MYALLPLKRVLTPLLAIIVVSIYVDDLLAYVDDLLAPIGIPVPKTIIVRYLPAALAVLLLGFFKPTGYWAPWRMVWRIVPRLNAGVFPDLNGIWEMRVDSATSTKQITENSPRDTPDQFDAMDVKITNNLFTLQIAANQSSTNGEFYTITAMPWRHQFTNRIHISYVYRQSTLGDENYLGAANLKLVDDDFSKAEGIYWTRQPGHTGHNTAGTLRLERKQAQKDTGKGLEEYKTGKRPTHQQGGKNDQPAGPQDDSSLLDRLRKLLWPFDGQMHQHQQDGKDGKQGSSQDDSSLLDHLRKLLPFW